MKKIPTGMKIFRKSKGIKESEIFDREKIISPRIPVDCENIKTIDDVKELIEHELDHKLGMINYISYEQ